MDNKNTDIVPFFNGPFNPKYKDLNLWNVEYYIPIKNYYDLTIERNMDRTKQKILIKKFKILHTNERPKFILN